MDCKITIVRVYDRHIQGKVQINTKDHVTILEGIIEIFGIANVKFQANKITLRFPQIITPQTKFTHTEEFYRVKDSFCKKAEHNRRGVYVFELGWPSNLPGTWIGDNLTIKYTGKLSVKTKNNDFFHTQEVFVSFYKNLSTEKHLLEEGNSYISKRLFMVKAWGELTVEVWTPLCGVALGQSLPVLCTVTNSSEMHFGGIIFVLTRIEIYRSSKPVRYTHKVRTDICRIARIVDIHKGKYEYFALMKIDRDQMPTLDFDDFESCNISYELWVDIEGTFKQNVKRYYRYIHTPVIPITIGTVPVVHFDPKAITHALFTQLNKIAQDTSQRTKRIETVRLFNKSELLFDPDDMSPRGVANLRRELEIRKNKAANKGSLLS